MTPRSARRTALVYGIALAGDALAQQLVAHGWRVIVADDDATDAKRAMAQAVGATLVEKPDAAAIEELVERCEMVCPAPGVPETHAVIAAAQSTTAYRFEPRSISHTSGSRTRAKGPATDSRDHRH